MYLAVISFISSHRYVKRYVKTAYVDIWVPGKWETIIHQSFWTVFNTPGNVTEKIKCVLEMNGQRRAWFTNVYLIFNPYVVERGDVRVLGVMAEADFVVWSLGSTLPPMPYRYFRPCASTEVIDDMCKKFIKTI